MDLISAVLVVGFMALIALAAWHELRVVARLRRSGSEEPRHRRRLRRRLLGLLFLALAVAILLNTPAIERLFTNPVIRLAWIGMAFVSVLIAVWLAFRDLSETGRMAEEEAKRVVMESLVRLQDEIAKAKRDKPGRPEDESPSREASAHGHPGTKKNRRPGPHRDQK